jgi:hypothetical protein
VHVDVNGATRIAAEEHIKQLIYPLNTVMDLNIGTALWFAAKGEGYLRSYSDEEIAGVQTASDGSGRPLLRAGAEDAARSVGLKSWSQKHLNGADHSRSDSDTGGSTQAATGTGAGAGQLKCGNNECKRVGKAGCIRSFCKKCCNTAQSQEVASYYADCAAAGTLVHEEELKLAVLDCPIHKFLWENKLCEKLKLQYADILVTVREHDSADDIGQSGETMIINGDEAEEKQSIEGARREQGRIQRVSTQRVSNQRVNYRSACKALLVGVGADEQLVQY